MKLFKSILTLLLAALAILAVFGFGWWSHPPEKLAEYAGGGRLILGLTVLASVIGVWSLWAAKDQVTQS